MEGFFNSSIIEELYRQRQQQYVDKMSTELPEEKKCILRKSGEIEETLEQRTEELLNIIPKEKQDEMKKLFNDYEQIHYKEVDLWSNLYYRMGIIDGIKLKNELKGEDI